MALEALKVIETFTDIGNVHEVQTSFGCSKVESTPKPLIDESTSGFSQVALQTLFLRLLLERSFTELGAPWLQKKNAKSLHPLHIMVVHPSENRFVSLRWVLLDWQLQCPRWLEKCLKYFDVIGFVRIQWLTLDGVGVGVVTQCRQNIVCIASCPPWQGSALPHGAVA